MTLAAAPQQPAGVPPDSLERITRKLEKTPSPRPRFDVPLQLPVATFRTRNQRAFVLTLEEELRKEFTLTLLQRQSQEWASRCCGLNLIQVVKSVDRALQLRKERKIREQTTRELAELQAARKERPPDER